MIVKNKKDILNRSSKLSNKYIKLIYKDSEKFNIDQDPASNIYFSIYCTAMVIAKISIGIEKFSEIYGLNNLTADEVKNMIFEVSKEIINANISQIN